MSVASILSLCARHKSLLPKHAQAQSLSATARVWSALVREQGLHLLAAATRKLS